MKKVIRSTRLSSDIKVMTKVLSKSNKVIVPTDKTNYVQVIELESYIKWVEVHLNIAATLSSRERLKEIYNDTKEMLKKTWIIL